MFPIYINDGNHEVPTDDVFYIIGKEGIFLRKKLGRIDAILPVDKISILGSVQTSAKYDIPKIPVKQFAQIVGFFKKIHELHKSEAIVLLHFNEETEEYKIQVPHQKVGPGSLDYIRTEVFPGFTNVSTIHSHSSMSAFHSGIDDRDEEDVDGLHITVGHLNWDNGRFDLSTSVVFNGHRFMVNAQDYIDGLTYHEVEETKDEDNDLLFSWYHRVYKKHNHINQKKVVKSPGFVLNHPNLNFPKKWLDYVTVKSTPSYTFSYGHRVYKNSARGGYLTNHYNKNQNIIDKLGMDVDNIEEFNQDYLEFEETQFNPCETCVFSDYKLLHEVEDNDIIDLDDEVEGTEENYIEHLNMNSDEHEGYRNNKGGEKI